MRLVDSGYTWVADVSMKAELWGCCLAAGPLPAHHRGTRRKYVRVGSYAASMPRKVPRRWAGKDRSRWSVCTVTSGARRALVQ
ncbi:hypothetical protein XHV734_1142 [Xanthomonas hortorum pv. vitians]|nr:hypothetical protein XHV734_1142 [Xanthomonas hortorum pv. vitians]